MLEESAEIVRIDEFDCQFVWVETKRKSSCGSCEAKSACGTQVLSKVVGKRSNQVKILNTCDAKIGDFIMIGIDEKAILRGSFNLYFVPLISMIIFSLFATLLAHKVKLSSYLTDVSSIVFAILGFLIGTWITRKRIKADIDNNCSSSQMTYQAKMLRVLQPKPAQIKPLLPSFTHNR